MKPHTLQLHDEPADGERHRRSSATRSTEPPETGAWSPTTTVVIAVLNTLVGFWIFVWTIVDDGAPADVDVKSQYVIALGATAWAIGLTVGVWRSLARPTPRSTWWFTIKSMCEMTLATIWLVSGVAACAVVTATWGWTIANDPSSGQLSVGAVHLHLAWEVVNAVPAVDLADTLGWERPIADPAGPLGVLSVIVRAGFLLGIVKLAVELVRRGRPQPRAVAGPPGAG